MKIIEIDAGNQVLCDFCSKDFTNSDRSGGLLVGSYAVGPCCAREAYSWNIKDQCPPGKSFADWVRQDLR